MSHLHNLYKVKPIIWPLVLAFKIALDRHNRNKIMNVCMLGAFLEMQSWSEKLLSQKVVGFVSRNCEC